MSAIFVDESGQLINSQRRYFVVAAFLTKNPRKTAKRFRAWHHSRFPRSVLHQSEVKFSNKNVDHKLRLKTLKFICSLNINIQYSYVFPPNIPSIYFHKGTMKSGHVYNEIVGTTLERFVDYTGMNFLAYCDKRHLRDFSESDFRKTIQTRIAPHMAGNSLIRITMVDSQQYSNIQIADWIVGAIAAYINESDYGDEYMDILQSNLLGSGNELFV